MNFVYKKPSIHEIRKLVCDELGRFYTGIKRLLNPHIYPVGLDEELHRLKVHLIQEARRHTTELEE